MPWFQFSLLRINYKLLSFYLRHHSCVAHLRLMMLSNLEDWLMTRHEFTCYENIKHIESKMEHARHLRGFQSNSLSLFNSHPVTYTTSTSAARTILYSTQMHCYVINLTQLNLTDRPAHSINTTSNCDDFRDKIRIRTSCHHQLSSCCGRKLLEREL